MNIKNIGLLLASVFLLSCSSIDDGNSFQNNQYCYVAGEGCALIGADDRCLVYSTTECLDSFRGTIKTYGWCNANFGPSKIFGCDNEDSQDGYCWYYGSCYSEITQSDCYIIGGLFYTNGCPSSPQPPPSGGQYCYIPSEYACALIGASSRCFVFSVAECQYDFEGSTKTLEWCNANLGSWNIYGCDAGYCWYYGECFEKTSQAECVSAGGTFYENSCPYEPPPPPPPPSGGQYCYDDYWGDCDLIGSDYNCLYNSASECTQNGNLVKTLEWCNANADVYGCVYYDY